MKSFPVQTQTIDAQSGEIISQRATPMRLLPPPKDACHVCARQHDPLLPHDAQSLYYQYAFYGVLGRWPTWADAAAHCDPETVKQWRAALEGLGHKWNRPPDGFLPVRDLGPDIT
jgi:hypothetical protein